MRCLCNCGQETKPGNRYVHGHNVAKPKRRLADVPTRRDEKTGCLLFLGSINQQTGYGYLGRRIAHRVAYEEAYGPIPDGLTIDHVHARGCRYRNCIEPTHLEAVTSAENTRRAMRVRPMATHCKRGHELSGENLVVRQHNGRAERLCVTCSRERGRAYHARARASGKLSTDERKSQQRRYYYDNVEVMRRRARDYQRRKRAEKLLDAF